MADLSILFAGGGSGGHITPALAIAERIVELKPDARTVFACSTRPVDRMMLSEAKVPFSPIAGAPFSARPAGALRFAAGFVRGRAEARAIIRRERVDRVVAMGGFVAAPVVAAARAETPVTLLNLDAPPGRANRWIARQCREVWSAVDVPELPRFAQRVVGMPVRRLSLAPGPRQECRLRLGLDPRRPTLLVTGASQGAGTINTLLASLVETDPEALGGWQVCHLAGPSGVAPAYAAAGIPAVVLPFLHEMGAAWGAADLAVSRAGASSVAEAWANAVPTLFLPYPHHRDRHQHRNALPMEAAGGAVIEADLVDPAANAGTGGAVLAALLRDAGRRDAMRESLRARPAPDAAAEIARLLVGGG